MFALGVRYLNGFVAACEPDSRSRPEWPPHPGRVFMALAAAYFAAPENPSERDALLWLESLPPPAIYAKGHLERACVTHYVPVNDKSGSAKGLMQSIPLRRNRQPRTFTRAFLEDETAYLCWPDIEPDPTMAAGLSSLCERVTRIGHSMSLVQVWRASPHEVPPPTWIPDDARAELQLRVATAGTLNELERCYNAAAVTRFADLKLRQAHTTKRKELQQVNAALKAEFPQDLVLQHRPRLASYQAYARPVAEAAKHAAPGTCFSPHLLIYTLAREEGPYFHLDLASSLAIIGCWRNALLANSNALGDDARQVLSGHLPNGDPLQAPHLAFIPLAFVAHEHADGRLLGMALTLPSALSAPTRRQLLRAIAGVQVIRAGRLGVWRVERPVAVRPPYNLLPNTWTAYPEGATHWSTVTPMVFDRHPKSDDPREYQRELQATVAQCCCRIGLPRPRSITPSAVSAHLGVPPSHAFPRLQRKDGSLRRHVHVILTFDEPVCGPVLLGAGRYRGYGCLRPIHHRT